MLSSNPRILIHSVRWENLRAQFKETYGENPEFVARAPGRVNLIGEHIDYCLFGVLPTAIDRDILIAVSTSDTTTDVEIANIVKKYPSRKFKYAGPNEIVPIDSKIFEWTNYFKCGYKGILTKLALKKPKGMKVMVDGRVPTGSGVSSSSAFVVCSALATLRANEVGASRVSKRELTELAIESERFVGVNSGGMDQSASVFSTAGNAVFISFYPKLVATPLALPDPTMVFVIANTLVVSDKHVTAPMHYNKRAVECSLAAHVLGKKLGLSNDTLKWITLRDVTEQYFAKKKATTTSSDETNAEEMETRLNEMIHLAQTHFDDDRKETGYSRKEIASMIGTTESSLNETFFTRFPVAGEAFYLYKRSMHVFTEALRVQRFRQICLSQKSGSTTLFSQLGQLMDESQDSCRELFDCSCPEVDEVCVLARKSGAVGSRVTGAGWGGCTVSLVPQNKVVTFIEKIKAGYYSVKFPKLTSEELDQAIFATRPGSGAALFTLDAR